MVVTVVLTVVMALVIAAAMVLGVVPYGRGSVGSDGSVGGNGGW